MSPAQRARMRAAIGSALQHAYLPAPAASPLTSDSTPSTTHGPSAADIARFRAELEALAGTTHDAQTVDHVVDIVVGVVRKQVSPRVLAWSDEALGMPGLRARLESAGITIVDPQLDQTGSRRDGQVAALAAATVGLTGSDAALSHTGSIVVTSGPGRPRLASLLTPVHMALVRVSTMVDALPTLIARRPELVAQGANFVCITGPSRTADIEHTLSRGVHGPGEIHAILLP